MKIEDYAGPPILSQLLGYVQSSSMMIDPQHMADYIWHITNEYLPEITEELREIGKNELAADVEKLSRYGLGLLLVFREKGMLEKLMPNEDYMKGIKLLHPELSNKAAKIAALGHLGYNIQKINNPFGIYDIDLGHILTGMTNFRGNKSRTPIIDVGIPKECPDAFREEYNPEKIDPTLLREQRLPEAMPRMQLHELNK